MLRTSLRRQSGMSAIPFIVSILVILALAYFWHAESKDADKYNEMAVSLRTEANELRGKFEATNNRLLALTEATGFGDAEGKPDQAAIQAALAAALEKWRASMALEFTADKYQATGTGGVIEKLEGDKIRVVYIPSKDIITNPSVQTILPLFEAAAARMQVDVKRFVEQHAAAVAANVAAEKTFADAIVQKDAEIGRMRTEMETGFRTRQESIEELRGQVASKDQAIQAAQSELETFRGEATRAAATASAEINRKTAELQTIVRRDQPFLSEGVDGRVLASGSGVVVIDRGRKDMLQPGTIFKVLGRMKGGDQYVKGAIKVMVSHDNTADARVIDQVASDPIGEGDLIQSETYSPNRVMRFVLVGEFRKMGRSQAEARLKQLGAQVDASVSPETHYIVIGAAPAGENMDDNEEVKRAKAMNITQLTEDQLASFTLY